MRPVLKAYDLSPASVDLINTLRAMTIVLEDGTKKEIDVARELRVPEDPMRVEREARKAPAQLAFWTRQLERVRQKIRADETNLTRFTSNRRLVYRKHVKDSSGDDHTEFGYLQALVDDDPEVYERRTALNALKTQEGMLRSLCDAVEHRVFILRRLTGQRQPGQS
jgi:hypothetical protein